MSATRPVAGFRFAGLACGIKGGAPDLGLILADEDVAAAGVFTKNRVCAAPVVLSKKRVRRGRLRAVLVNSGNANACTGDQGERDARSMTATLAAHVGVRARSVGVASTGVIGVPLPIDRVEAAIPDLYDGASETGIDAFATAILTTDRGPKVARTEFRYGKRSASLLAVAKGAGMIHPDMATTLAFVTTDAPVDAAFLQRALREATGETFNAISVDGDTSTNDSIFALASGAAGGRSIDGGRRGKQLLGALTEALREVALMIVADGEGAEHVAEIVVRGARRLKDARSIAKTIATSQLVKTALHGCDPNWGRIMGAAGRAGVRLDPQQCRLTIGDTLVFAKGAGVMDADAEAAASRTMAGPHYVIQLDLGAGSESARYYTCDLGHEYVRINADYRS